MAAKVVGVFGVRGWVKIKAYTEDPKSLLTYKPWLIKHRSKSGAKIETAYEIEAHQFRPQGLVVKFKGLDDRDEAAILVGSLIEVASDSLPPLEEGDYYWRDLIGLTVVSQWDGQEYVFGRVVRLLETGANDVLVVQGKPSEHIDDRERLIPYVMDQYVIDIDLSARVLKVHWDPEF